MVSRAEKQLQAYPADAEKDDVHRAADFLFWASRKFPQRPVPFVYIVAKALMLTVIPRESNKQVVAFREGGRMSRVRSILLEEYQCEMKYVRGVGYRATTDGNDIMDVAVEGRTKAVRNAAARLDRTLGLVKPSELSGKERKTRLKILTNINDELQAPKIKDRLVLPDPDKHKK